MTRLILAEEKLYCYCKKTHDPELEWIACDYDGVGGCPIEWFHLSCVSITKLTKKIKKSKLFLKELRV